MAAALMWVLASGSLVTGGAAAGPAGQPQRPVRKVFISADLEGVAGVVQPSQLGTSGFEYARAREWVTGEVKAAIDAARSVGASEFVVADSHGNAQNLLIDQLPDDATVVRGFPRPLDMMQGIDDSFDAAIFIGYHAREGTPDAVRSHTMSSARLLGIKLNGTPVMEAVFNAAIAGHFGVPVIFLSGDRAAVTEFQRTVPAAEGVVLKDAFGYHSARTVTPAKARQLITAGVVRALKNAGAVAPYRLRTPIEFEVGFKSAIDAERAAFIPGVARIDGHWVRGTLPDMVQIAKLIQVMTDLQPPQ